MFKRKFFPVVAAACLIAPVVAAETSAVADPDLSVWINKVLSQNPELQAAEAAVDAAGGRLRAADQPMFNPGLEFEHESSEIDTTTGGISQAIDWSGKREARTGVAQAGQAAAVTELRVRRQALATKLLRALADWQSAEAIVHISKQQSELMTRFARLAEQRRQAGDLDQVELDLAHLASADAAFQQSNAQGNLIRTRQAVIALTGDALASWPRLTGALPELDPVQAIEDRLLADLPVLQAALARVAAARASLQVSLREKRPDPTIGIRAGREDSDTLAGVTLSVPLFLRNTYSAEVDVANAELIQAERKAASLHRQARADLVSAAEIYRNAQQTWLTWVASGAPRLSQSTELLNRLWQAGELDTTDYLVQLKQALETEVSALAQHARMWQAWADWLAASGRIAQWLNLEGVEQ
jgi:cobalt-zinc-cadmium efflux system outer membrane protein